MKIRKIEHVTGSPDYEFECPGCGCLHGVWTYDWDGPKWSFNGDVDKPTFKPSIRVRWTYGVDRIEHVCHAYVREGRIEFLNDCTHSLAGKTIELPDL